MPETGYFLAGLGELIISSRGLYYRVNLRLPHRRVGNHVIQQPSVG